MVDVEQVPSGQVTRGGMHWVVHCWVSGMQTPLHRNCPVMHVEPQVWPAGMQMPLHMNNPVGQGLEHMPVVEHVPSGHGTVGGGHMVPHVWPAGMH